MLARRPLSKLEKGMPCNRIESEAKTREMIKTPQISGAQMNLQRAVIDFKTLVIQWNVTCKCD